MNPNRIWTPGPDSHELYVDAMESKPLNLCAYCNNPVPDGKFVHARCEEKHDEREEQNDQDERENI